MRRSAVRFNLFRILSSIAFAISCTATLLTAQTNLQTLHQFTGLDGGYPIGNLISDSAGNLYGTAEDGGLQNAAGCVSIAFNVQGYCGTVFKLSKSSGGGWTTTILYQFTGGADGGSPYAGLAIDREGNLYGTTAFGGTCPFAFGCGVVFKLSPTSSGPWTETVLYAFQAGNDGGVPESQLVFDSSGNLYGTTLSGGNGFCGLGVPCGVVFEVSPTSSGPWTESVLYSFQEISDGAEPTGTLVFDSRGNLYGTTSIGGDLNSPCGYPFFGCGTVFQLSPSSSGWTKTILHAFEGGIDGAFPNGGVIVDHNGRIYGATNAGGIRQWCGANVPGCGVIYTIRPTSSGGWTENVLKSFQPNTSGGQRPIGNLVLDSAGSLYGTALDGKLPGGATGAGVVFKLSPSGNSWTETVLHTFSSASNAISDGTGPNTSLLVNSAGNLFGTSLGGGIQNQTECGGYCGVVFELLP